MAIKEKIYFTKTEIIQEYFKGKEKLTDKINDTWLIYPDEANLGKNYWVAISLETAKVGFADSIMNAYSDLVTGMVSALIYRKNRYNDIVPLGFRAREEDCGKLIQAIPLDYDEQAKYMLNAHAMLCPNEPNVINNNILNFGENISLRIIEP